MANITVPDKSPGDQHTAAELDQQVNWINSPMKSLGAFNPAMVFDSQGSYNTYTQTNDIVISATGIINGLFRSLYVIADGIHTITAGEGISASITDLSNVVDAGTYLFMFGSFPDENGTPGVVVGIPNLKQAVIPTLTTPTLTATVGDAQIQLLITNEDPAQTGRALLRNTVNDFITATPVSGYDNTTDYVDSGLVNGTEYFYFFYNTAAGYNNSGIAEYSATPSPSIIVSSDITHVTITNPSASMPITTPGNEVVFTPDGLENISLAVNNVDSLHSTDNGTIALNVANVNLVVGNRLWQFMRDGSNFLQIVRGATDKTRGRIQIWEAGIKVYELESTESFEGLWKIYFNNSNNEVKFYKWDGVDTWDQIGVTQVSAANAGAKTFYATCENSTSDPLGTWTLSQYYMTNDNYSTQIPT